MTDKVQKIREEIEKRLKGERFLSSDKEYNYLLSFIDSLQEEPVSEELKIELEKYIKDHFTIDTEQLDRFGIEEKDYMYSMDKSDMFALVEHFINWHKTKEEPVSEVWHDASKEPNDMSHCLIFYGDKNDVGHYLHYEPVLYNHQDKVFVTSSFPHPTGYKVEQKSIDGGCVAEVYKNKRDRISISDITQWCYLKDLHNLSNVQRTIKNWKEQMMAKAVDATVHIDAGNYPYIPQLELYDYDKDVPLAKEGDKYKVILIKEE